VYALVIGKYLKCQMFHLFLVVFSNIFILWQQRTKDSFHILLTTQFMIISTLIFLFAVSDA